MAATGAANGTASVPLGDYVLVKDAPTTSGTGSPGSSSPANGLYQCTSVSGGNIALQRATQMSGTGAAATPAGMQVAVMTGTVNGGLTWFVSSPSSYTSFTYGTTGIQFSAATVTPTQTVTLGNKRVTKRVGSVASASSNTISIDTDNYDVFKVTALASAVTTWTITGTPNDRDEFTLCITDTGTSRNLSGWSSWAISSGAAHLPAATSAGNKMTMKFVYDADYSAWALLAVDSVGYN